MPVAAEIKSRRCVGNAERQRSPRRLAGRARAARDTPRARRGGIGRQYRLTVGGAQHRPAPPASHRRDRCADKRSAPDARLQFFGMNQASLLNPLRAPQYRQREQRHRRHRPGEGAQRPAHDPRPSRLQRLGPLPRPAAGSRAAGSASGSIRCPSKARHAGSRVSAASTDTSTTNAPPIPTLRVSRMGLNSNPSSPIATVEPDQQYRGARLRHRVGHRRRCLRMPQPLAILLDHQQRIVDSHREPDHRDDVAEQIGYRHQLGQHESEPERQLRRRETHQERQRGGDEGPESQDEYRRASAAGRAFRRDLRLRRSIC